MTETEKLLRELIALPSVNPAFLPLNDPRAGEGRVADFLVVMAARAGLDVDFQKVLPGRSNVLATLSPPGKVKQRLLLAPHLDTVNAVSEKQFVPRSANGRNAHCLEPAGPPGTAARRNGNCFRRVDG